MSSSKTHGHGHDKAAAAKHTDVDQLNTFLRAELAAVETYKLALDNLEHPSKARTQLESCLQSHQQRVSLLRAAIAQQHGVPVDHGPPAWEGLVRVVEGLADDIGDKATVAALEQGEEHGLEDYRVDLTRLAASSQQLVQMQLLPKQVQSHHAISELKKQLH
jgi:hypothetical protein